MTYSYLTSNDLIASIQRKISMPNTQVTFSNNDILAFVNEEMMSSQTPSMMEYHEEFLVFSTFTPLIQNQNRYPVPGRAIGMRLREIFFQDTSGNIFDMTRISPDEAAYFSRNMGADTSIAKYYFEGNDVVCVPNIVNTNGAGLLFKYYIRPNQLVTNDQASFINTFTTNVTFNNAFINVGDTVTIAYNQGGVLLNSVTLTATNTTPVGPQFLIGSNSIFTTQNFINAVNANGMGFYNAINYTNPGTTIAAVQFTTQPTNITTSNMTGGIVVDTNLGLQSSSAIPSQILSSSLIDLLETEAGHRIKAFDITPSGFNTFLNIILIPLSSVPYNLVIGDYVCPRNACIIPYLPDDLHTILAERSSGRILASIGDATGLQMTNAKIEDMNQRQGTLVDNRNEGNPQKIMARHTILRYNKSGVIRRV